MPLIHLVKELLQKDDWMMKLDLKDTYIVIPFHQDHHQYLQIHRKGTTYQFNCLPFNLLSAPRIFMEIMHPVVAWLQQLSCRIITYINDNLIMAPAKEEADLLEKLLICLLEALGFVINCPKFIIQPARRCSL